MAFFMKTLSPRSPRGFTRALGPAIIVACVVLGPGSILTSSKVGCRFGYELIWVLAGAGLLMIGAVATSARIGVSLKGTPCTELANRLGRPVAALAGIAVFLIASCFQFSNNLGVLAAIEPLLDSGGDSAGDSGKGLQNMLLIGLNLALIACLLGFKKLYQPIEKIMMFLVGLMLLGFAANLVMARPSLLSFLAGMIPSLPQDISGGFFPVVEELESENSSDAITRVLVDPWVAVQGLVVTTFSIAGAFYQAYLVKEKGWTIANLRQGLIDSVAGISVLVGITLMILVTSASVLFGNVAPSELKSVADVAQQLEPLFGSTAKVLFCVGIFAGAISSFLVNSIIGGTLLADGLGLDARMDSKWTRLFTVAVLLIGIVIALTTDSEGRVPLIIFAQACTVLGGPILAFSLLYLAWQPSTTGVAKTPTWMLGITSVGAVVVFALASRTAVALYHKVLIFMG